MDKALEDYLNANSNPSLDSSDKPKCLFRVNFNERSYHIHEHAFEKYDKRIKKLDPRIKKASGVVKSLIGLLKRSEAIERRSAVAAIIKYDFKTVDYLYSDGWVFVVEDKDIVKTVYHIGSIKNKGSWRGAKK